MSAALKIPARAEARKDPDHRRWFAFVDAVNAGHIAMTDERAEAIDRTYCAWRDEFLAISAGAPERSKLA